MAQELRKQDEAVERDDVQSRAAGRPNEQTSGSADCRALGRVVRPLGGLLAIERHCAPDERVAIRRTAV
jgi:hypothetical protein